MAWPPRVVLADAFVVGILSAAGVGHDPAVVGGLLAGAGAPWIFSA